MANERPVLGEIRPIRGLDISSLRARGGGRVIITGREQESSHLVPFNLVPSDFSQHFSSDSFHSIIIIITFWHDI